MVRATTVLVGAWPGRRLDTQTEAAWRRPRGSKICRLEAARRCRMKADLGRARRNSRDGPPWRHLQSVPSPVHLRSPSGAARACGPRALPPGAPLPEPMDGGGRAGAQPLGPCRRQRAIASSEGTAGYSDLPPAGGWRRRRSQRWRVGMEGADRVGDAPRGDVPPREPPRSPPRGGPTW